MIDINEYINQGITEGINFQKLKILKMIDLKIDYIKKTFKGKSYVSTQVRLLEDMKKEIKEDRFILIELLEKANQELRDKRGY